MYNLIPLIIIIVSLIIMIFIVVRKFPALASLDIETVQAEKEAKFKEQIIGNRLKRNIIKWLSQVQKVIQPVLAWLNIQFAAIYSKLLKMKDRYKENISVSDSDSKEKIEKLFVEFDDFKKKEELDEAEKRLIEIIGLESKNTKAFKELGQLYVAKRNFSEAKETYKHLIKLLEVEEETDSTNVSKNLSDDKSVGDYNAEKSQAYLNLALICQASDLIEEANENVNKALEIEPNNPRYLDTWLEISIIRKDKIAAQNAYERLEKVNPENQKLEEIKVKIEEI